MSSLSFRKSLSRGAILAVVALGIGISVYAVGRSTNLFTSARKPRRQPSPVVVTSPTPAPNPKQDRVASGKKGKVSRCSGKGGVAKDTVSGTVTVVSADQLVLNDGTVVYNCQYTNVSGMHAQFPEKITLDEIVEGDTVVVTGTAFTLESSPATKVINAVTVVDKDFSLKRLEGGGTVVSISPAELKFTVKSGQKKSFTVQITAQTQCFNKKGGSINCTQIRVGHLVGLINGQYRPETRTIIDTSKITDRSI